MRIEGGNMDNKHEKIINRMFKADPALRKAFKDEVMSSTAATRANMLHEDNRAAKEFARQIASNSWIENPDEKTNDLACYICEKLVDNGHKIYKSGTVKDWIKDLAPPELRKPGRPANPK